MRRNQWFLMSPARLSCKLYILMSIMRIWKKHGMWSWHKSSKILPSRHMVKCWEVAKVNTTLDVNRMLSPVHISSTWLWCLQHMEKGQRTGGRVPLAMDSGKCLDMGTPQGRGGMTSPSNCLSDEKTRKGETGSLPASPFLVQNQREAPKTTQFLTT